jgi:hypothetical protein
MTINKYLGPDQKIDLVRMDTDECIEIILKDDKYDFIY